MLYKILITAFLGLALAAPLEGNTTLTKRWPGPGDCGDSFFFDRTSDASPLVSDCRALIDDIKRTFPNFNQQYNAKLPNTDEDPFRLREWGSCIFGIRKAFAGPQETYASVGTDDVIDLIDDSIRRYERNGRVGSEGAMYCKNIDTGTSEGVWWGLF